MYCNIVLYVPKTVSDKTIGSDLNSVMSRASTSKNVVDEKIVYETVQQYYDRANTEIQYANGVLIFGMQFFFFFKIGFHVSS